MEIDMMKSIVLSGRLFMPRARVKNIFPTMAKDLYYIMELETIKTSEKFLSMINRNPSSASQNLEIDFND